MNPMRNIYGNVLAFMPLGFLLPLLFDKYNKVSKVLIFALSSSVGIEVVQLFIGGNVCDIDDVIYNTSGAVLGLLCFKLLVKISKNTKLVNMLDKVKDCSTENIFRKSMKVILPISVLVGVVYVHGVYDQTASDKLSDKELAQAVFKDDILEMIETQYIGEDKLYLVKDNESVTVRRMERYSDSRYVNSHQSYRYMPVNSSGYIVDISYRYNNEFERECVDIIVYGKNTKADNIVISIGGKEYQKKLEPDKYFLASQLESIELDYDEIDKIYSGEKSDIIDIKFLDKDNNEVDDIKLLIENIY